jgi:hypothetical protein
VLAENETDETPDTSHRETPCLKFHRAHVTNFIDDLCAKAYTMFLCQGWHTTRVDAARDRDIRAIIPLEKVVSGEETPENNV